MRTRAFWLANVVILLDEVLYLALIPLLPDYSSEFGLSKAEAGFLYGAYPLLVLASSIPAGLVVERLGTRRMLIIGCALLVGSTIGFAYAQTEWHVWVSRAVQGVTAGLVATAGMAAIAAAADQRRRATTIGVAVSLQGISGLAGYALGGFLAPAVGIRNAFLVPGGLGVVVLVWLVLDRSLPVAPPLRLQLRAAALAPLRSVAVRAAVACILSVGLAGSAAQTLTALDLDAAGYSTSELGATFLIAAAAAFVSTPLAGRVADRHGVVPATRVWAVLMPVLVVALAVVGSAWATSAVLVTVLVLVRVGGTLAYARGAEYAGLGEGLAATYGLAITAWSLGAVAGPLVAGAIADATSSALALGCVAALCGVIAIPAWFRSPADYGSTGAATTS